MVSQDLPPSGGFPPIHYKRYLPPRGPPGILFFVGGALIMSVGLYVVGQGNIARRELKREKILGRMNLIPLLQAEEDRK
jgi:NADH dehydrogenase (ubiquinone) 1 alpha subcomplex subunit 13